MIIKSYFSRSVEDAIATAALELGADAMLLNSRKSPPESRHRGEYEVVFAVDRPAPGEHGKAEPGVAPPPADHLSRSDRLSKQVADLKKELEGMRRSITRTFIAPPQMAAAPPDLSDAYALLTAHDVAPELARELVERAQARLGASRYRAGQRNASFQNALGEELESRFTVEARLGRGDTRPAIVALVGPPGAGKTTTLVKLAIHYGLAGRRPVLLISADNYRVAAGEQLRYFATILGVGFQALETVGALAQTIEENRSKDLILIDTPGFGFQDIDNAAPLAEFLSSRNDVDTHLVLQSSMKSADLSRVADAFEIFRPGKLLFTRLDETASFGPLFSEAVRTGKPLSFFATGQRIPEDLETAGTGRMVELLLRKTTEARSAA
jgi:flagellar biosynthesis protein FlhF